VATKKEQDAFFSGIDAPSAVPSTGDVNALSAELDAILPPVEQPQAPQMAKAPQRQHQGNDLITSGDMPDLNSTGRPFSEAEQPPGALQNALGGVVETGLEGLKTGAASASKGLVGVADLPANMVNLTSHVAGRGNVLPTIGGTEFGQAATASNVPEEDRNFVSDALEKTTEFYGGGAAFAKLFKAASAKNPTNLRSSTGSLVAEQLGKFNAPVERAAAVGAGVAGAGAEYITDSPITKAAFEIGGALVGGGGTAFAQQGGKATARAGKAVQEEVANRDQALKNIQAAREGVPGVEATNDQGIMDLYQGMIRNDHSLEQKYSQYVKESSDVMQSEISELLGTGGRVEEGAMQDFLGRNKAVLVDMVDQRVAQADRIVKEAKSIGGRNVNDVEQSKIVDREVNAAIDDIGNQNKINWDIVGDAGVESLPVQDIRDAAKNIVDDFSKTSRPSKELLSQLETVLGKRVKKTSEGYAVSEEASSGSRFLADEKVSELIKARGKWESLKREAQSGTSGNSEDARTYIQLSESALGALENSTGAGPAYETARAFTRRFKELTTQGRLGSSSRRTAQGDTRVPPEKTGQTLFGGDRAGAAVGAREATELSALQAEARAGQGLPPSSGVEGASSEFLLTQFQRKARDGADAAARWAEDHETAMQSFPEMERAVRDTVKTLAAQEGRLSVLGTEKAALEKDAFFKIADMNSPRAVNHILDSVKPDKTVADLLTRLQTIQTPKGVIVRKLDDPTDALIGFKNGVADYALNSFATPTKGASFSKASKVLNRLKPILNSKAYSTKDREAMSIMLRELEVRAKLMTEGRTGGVPLKNSMFSNLAGRWLGARVMTSFATGAGNIILAGAGARVGGELLSNLSNKAVDDIMAAAMMDKKLMSKLIKLDTSKATARAEASRIVASVNASAAQELEQDQQQEAQ